MSHVHLMPSPRPLRPAQTRVARFVFGGGIWLIRAVDCGTLDMVHLQQWDDVCSWPVALSLGGYPGCTI